MIEVRDNSDENGYYDNSNTVFLGVWQDQPTSIYDEIF